MAIGVLVQKQSAMNQNPYWLRVRRHPLHLIGGANARLFGYVLVRIERKVTASCNRNCFGAEWTTQECG
jgi:hypothetical protein